MARKKKIENNIIEEIVTNTEPVEEQPVVEEPAAEVELQEEVVEEAPKKVEAPVQVKSNKVVFVPFEDFEGRINNNTFNYKKGVPVECTIDEAHTWVDAEKGYIK